MKIYEISQNRHILDAICEASVIPFTFSGCVTDLEQVLRKATLRKKMLSEFKALILYSTLMGISNLHQTVYVTYIKLFTAHLSTTFLPFLQNSNNTTSQVRFSVMLPVCLYTLIYLS